MEEFNRCVVLIKPTQRCIDWLNQHAERADENDIINLIQARKDCTCLLVPLLKNREDIDCFLIDIAESLFEHELAKWFIDERMWPENRDDYQVFLEWFDIEVHSSVYDLSSLLITTEN